MKLYFQVTFSFLSPVTPAKTLLENISSTQREKRISIYGDESEFVTCLLSLSKETSKFVNFLSRAKKKSAVECSSSHLARFVLPNRSGLDFNFLKLKLYPPPRWLAAIV